MKSNRDKVTVPGDHFLYMFYLGNPYTSDGLTGKKDALFHFVIECLQGP